MNFLKWPPPREGGDLASYSEQQLQFWLRTAPLDSKGKDRIRDAIQRRRQSARQVTERESTPLQRAKRRAYKRRNSDPPKPSNAELAGSGFLGGLGGSGGLAGVLAAIEVYRQIKESGIAGDIWWVISLFGKIEFTFGQMLGIFCVGALGMLLVPMWKLFK